MLKPIDSGSFLNISSSVVNGSWMKSFEFALKPLDLKLCVNFSLSSRSATAPPILVSLVIDMDAERARRMRFPPGLSMLIAGPVGNFELCPWTAFGSGLGRTNGLVVLVAWEDSSSLVLDVCEWDVVEPDECMLGPRLRYRNYRRGKLTSFSEDIIVLHKAKNVPVPASKHALEHQSQFLRQENHDIWRARSPSSVEHLQHSANVQNSLWKRSKLPN